MRERGGEQENDLGGSCVTVYLAGRSPRSSLSSNESEACINTVRTKKQANKRRTKGEER